MFLHVWWMTGDVFEGLMSKLVGSTGLECDQECFWRFDWSVLHF